MELEDVKSQLITDQWTCDNSFKNIFNVQTASSRSVYCMGTLTRHS